MMMNNTAAYRPSAMAKISHELRIPLTGIIGMAHFLAKTHLTSEQKECLQIITTSADRLLGLEEKLHAIIKETKGNDL